MAVNKVVRSTGETIIDISDSTAGPDDVAEGKIFYLADGTRAVGRKSGESGPSYETIIPLQTINCTIALSNGAYGGYIAPYTEFITDGQKYHVTFDGTEYTATASYYGTGTNYLVLGDIRIETASGSAAYPFEIVLYSGQVFYLGVKGSGSHTLQVDKIL